MEKVINHLYIILTIVFAVASQFLMRWQASGQASIPQGGIEKLAYFLSLLSNPWILLAFIFTALSGFSWLLAMTKFELSYAYPFVSLNYVCILLLAPLLLNESVSLQKLTGSAVIVLGIIILSKG